eukprot:9760-Eustigmatos_ZCMA.PRE.1
MSTQLSTAHVRTTTLYVATSATDRHLLTRRAIRESLRLLRALTLLWWSATCPRRTRVTRPRMCAGACRGCL